MERALAAGAAKSPSLTKAVARGGSSLLGSWPGCLPHPLPNIMKMNKEGTWLEQDCALKRVHGRTLQYGTHL
jgi:hypothetical protein